MKCSGEKGREQSREKGERAEQRKVCKEDGLPRQFINGERESALVKTEQRLVYSKVKLHAGQSITGWSPG